MPRAAAKPKPAEGQPANTTTAVAVVDQQGPLVTRAGERVPAIVVIKEELEKRATDLLQVLPPGMDAERFMRVSILAVSKNPDILECTPGSIIRSVIEAAEIGLEPTGSLNRAWLVPFRNDDTKKKEAQLMIGYQGYADLMRDSGRVTRITTECVYKGDHFRVVKGSEEPRIEHEPAFQTEKPEDIEYVYGVAWFADGGSQFEVMSHAQIELIRARSKQRNGPTWTQNWPQMARKTLIRRLANYVPLTARAIAAIARDDEREFGTAGPLPAAHTGSRTASVRERVLERGQKVVSPAPTASEAPGAAETPGADTDAAATPSASASQQTDGQGAQEGTAREICGAQGTDVAEGEVCTLDPDHGGKVHKSEKASWPVVVA